MKPLRTTKSLAMVYCVLSLVIALIIPHIFDVLMNQCSCRKPRQSPEAISLTIAQVNISDIGSSGSGNSGGGSSSGTGGESSGGTSGGSSGSGGTGSGSSGSGGTGSESSGSGGNSEGSSGSGGNSEGSSGSDGNGGGSSGSGGNGGESSGSGGTGSGSSGSDGTGGGSSGSDGNGGGSSGSGGTGGGSPGSDGTGGGSSGSGGTGGGSSGSGGTGGGSSGSDGNSEGTSGSDDTGGGSSGSGSTGGGSSGSDGTGSESSGSDNTSGGSSGSGSNGGGSSSSGGTDGSGDGSSNSGGTGGESSDVTDATGNASSGSGSAGDGSSSAGGTGDGSSGGTGGGLSGSDGPETGTGGSEGGSTGSGSSNGGSLFPATLRPDLPPGLQPNLNQSSRIPASACVPTLPLPMKSIVNPHINKYVVTNFKFCQDRAPLFILIVVNTVPSNADLRQVIRNTWGNQNLFQQKKHAVMFFMGTSNIASVNEAVRRESNQYGDISVQGFKDTYENLSFKSMMWLQWSAEYCSNAEYIVKVEDVTVVNVYHLTSTLADIFQNQENGYRDRFICQIWSGMSVIRNNALDWHVNNQEYQDNTYPEYCSGLGYIIGKELLPLLNNASYYVPYFKVEDVYVTGMLKKYLNVQTHNIWNKYAFNQTDLKKITSGSGIFGFADKKDTNRYRYWEEIKKSSKL